MKRVVCLLISLFCCQTVFGQLDRNSHLSMMRHTVLLTAPGSAAGGFSGAGIIVGRPLKTDQRKFLSILVTANSVFEQITNQTVRFSLRFETNTSWSEMVLDIPIRSADGTKLWTSHTNADVAAIMAPIYYDAFPNRTIINTSRLLTDDMVKQFHVGPGDDIFCLWFGLGVQTPFKFPFLREGRIASFPLSPMKDIGTWACDFNGFKGNIGSPIYLVKQDPYDASRRFGGNLFAVAGLVTKTNSVVSANDSASIQKESGLCFVVPAAYIRETIDSVPEPSPADLLPYEMRPGVQ
jgi:hypothetical protein